MVFVLRMLCTIHLAASTYRYVGWSVLCIALFIHNEYYLQHTLIIRKDISCDCHQMHMKKMRNNSSTNFAMHQLQLGYWNRPDASHWINDMQFCTYNCITKIRHVIQRTCYICQIQHHIMNSCLFKYKIYCHMWSLYTAISQHVVQLFNSQYEQCEDA